MRLKRSISLDEEIVSLVKARAEKTSRSFSRQIEVILQKHFRVKGGK